MEFAAGLCFFVDSCRSVLHPMLYGDDDDDMMMMLMLRLALITDSDR